MTEVVSTRLVYTPSQTKKLFFDSKATFEVVGLYLTSFELGFDCSTAVNDDPRIAFEVLRGI